MNAQTCPNCFGRGLTFKTINYGTIAQTTIQVACPTCKGKGWITIPEDEGWITIPEEQIGGKQNEINNIRWKNNRNN